jgi:hypothetical protein
MTFNKYSYISHKGLYRTHLTFIPTDYIILPFLPSLSSSHWLILFLSFLFFTHQLSSSSRIVFLNFLLPDLLPSFSFFSYLVVFLLPDSKRVCSQAQFKTSMPVSYTFSDHSIWFIASYPYVNLSSSFIIAVKTICIRLFGLFYFKTPIALLNGHYFTYFCIS